MEHIFEQLKQALLSGSIASTFFAVILCYIGGILSSFTPCIYPMIPITIGFIGGTSDRSLKSGWILSSLYVLGMALIYTVLGIFAAFSGRIFGTMTNSSGWYLGLGIIMILSSLWMMDVIKFDPQVWIQKFKGHKIHHHPPSERSKEISAFLFGFSSGFIAAPCTTPVLTTILSYIATTRSMVMGALLMFTFACGLGTILVLIGSFAGAVKVMPKSGKWMQSIKLFSGLLILVIAQYYIYKAGTVK